MRKTGGSSSDENDPDWESFETSGPEIENEFVIDCPRLAQFFHWAMVSLGLAIVFVFGGAFFWFSLSGPRALELTRAESSGGARGQFIVGGLIAVGWIIKLLHLPGRHRDR